MITEKRRIFFWFTVSLIVVTPSDIKRTFCSSSFEPEVSDREGRR